MPARLTPSACLARARRPVMLCRPLALLALAGLAACSPSPPDASSLAGAPAPSLRPRGPAREAPLGGTPPAADLIPLPSPETVLNRVPLGRSDPFAPLQGSQPQPPSQPAAPVISLPVGFRLRGLLRVAGRDQAFVQSATGSGVICLGPQGRCAADSEPLLPKGITVVAIQPQIGCILVVASGQRTRHCLQSS